MSGAERHQHSSFHSICILKYLLAKISSSAIIKAINLHCICPLSLLITTDLRFVSMPIGTDKSTGTGRLGLDTTRTSVAPFVLHSWEGMCDVCWIIVVIYPGTAVMLHCIEKAV